MKRSLKTLADHLDGAWTHSSAQGALARSTISQPHVRLVTMIVLAVFVCEALVMFILSYLPVFPTWLQALYCSHQFRPGTNDG